MNIFISEEDLAQLDVIDRKANSVAYGSPDQYQFHQNELIKCLSYIVLKQYRAGKSERS